MLYKLSSNTLKIIAAVTMFIDHMGMLLFPDILIFRIVGRIAFPIYAFMIAEGCKYTRNRLKYFAHLAGLAAVCQIVYFLFDGSTFMCVLVTFSLSVIMIEALNRLKAAPNARNTVIFTVAVAGVYILNRVFDIDYGFWGCMLPVFASFFHGTKYDDHRIHTIMLALGMIPLFLTMSSVQIYALMAVPLLLCYSGRRGKWKMKYFFYIFYPLHLALLQGISYFMQ